MRPRNEDCYGNAIQEYSENLLFGVLASNDGGGGGGGGGEGFVRELCYYWIT